MKETICNFTDIDNIDIYNIGKYIGEYHFLECVINELKSAPSDNVVIWGTYNNAIRLRDYLAPILPDSSFRACVINREYCSVGVNDTETRGDFPKYALEDWLDQNNNTTILIDFSFYRSEMLEKYATGIDRVFVGDLMGTIILEKPYCISKEMFFAHRQEILSTMELLEDEESKRDFALFILQKNIGFYNKPYSRLPQYFDRQYINTDAKTVFVDCGAYTGDTINNFVSFTDNQYKHIYAFEMDEANFNKLQCNVGENDRVTCINKGVGANNLLMKADTGKMSASRISDSGESIIEIVALDSLFESEKVTFIKMDIEGFELDALKGAKGIIKRDMPDLAISLYHKFEDIYLIPQYIKELCENYKLYFKNYHNSASECVLYAVKSDIECI